MTEFGRSKIEEDKREGRFVAKERPQITQEQIDAFAKRLAGTEPAYSNFMKMSPSVQRTYTGFSLDVKSEEASQKRLQKIIERLNENLKPM